MKVFLSWSGEASSIAARAFHDWLPVVLQQVDPFMSEEDIAVGGRWSRQLDQELEASSFGIVFITPENQARPWLLFEAGALSKSIDDSRVSPLLLGITRAELTGPLTHFQSVLANKEEVRKLVTSVNTASTSSLADDRLDMIFETWWQQLKPNLDKAVKVATTEQKGVADAGRSGEDIAAETLEIVRSLQRLISDPASLLPQDYLEWLLRDANRSRGPNLKAIDDLEVGWENLVDAVAAVRDADNTDEAGDILQNAIDDLEPPIDYIVRMYRRRRPPSGQQELQSIPSFRPRAT